MELTIGGHTYGVTTGGYESAIPTNAIHELEEATHRTRLFRGGFPAEEVDLSEIFNSDVCSGPPMFTIQFGRSSDVNEHATYQAVGAGVPSLDFATANISELSQEIEGKFDFDTEYTTHRPFVRAHTSLRDGSVLYVGVYYYSRDAETVKNFELVTFHPKMPFNSNRYGEIFQASPTREPDYIEEADITKGNITINDSPGYAGESEAFPLSTPDIARVENPMKFRGRSYESPWNAFESPHHLFAQSYVYGDEYDDLTASLRAASPEEVESVFYQMEIE